MSATRSIVKATAIVVASVLLAPVPALAQAAKAGVVTTLEGTATVARAATPTPVPLRFRDDVFVRDRIVTADSSIVRILLGGKAVITVRERSSLTISETATTSTVEITTGKIALAVARARMQAGESIEIKTPNAVAGVRGTVIIAEVGAGGGSAFTSQFTLLSGIVDVTRLDGTGVPSGTALTLQPLQTIGVTGALGSVRTLTRTEADAIAQAYKVPVPLSPPAATVHVTDQQVKLAAQHVKELTQARGAGGGLEKDGHGGIKDSSRSGGRESGTVLSSGGGNGVGGGSGGGVSVGGGSGRGLLGGGGGVLGGGNSGSGSLTSGSGSLGSGSGSSNSGGGIIPGLLNKVGGLLK